MSHVAYKPTGAYIGASYTALGIGILAYLIGLWGAEMQLNEKGYYFTILIMGLYSAISVQKAVRDRAERIPTSGLYLGISYVVLMISILLLMVGLWNATLLRSEKGFYAMAYVLSLFSVITVQKNVRDLQYDKKHMCDTQDKDL